MADVIISVIYLLKACWLVNEFILLGLFKTIQCAVIYVYVNHILHDFKKERAAVSKHQVIILKRIILNVGLGLVMPLKESVILFVFKFNSMKKMFILFALILSVGLGFASLNILQTTMAQLEVPPTTNVTILNETAINDTISNSTNDPAGMTESAKP